MSEAISTPQPDPTVKPFGYSGPHFTDPEPEPDLQTRVRRWRPQPKTDEFGVRPPRPKPKIPHGIREAYPDGHLTVISRLPEMSYEERQEELRIPRIYPSSSSTMPKYLRDALREGRL